MINSLISIDFHISLVCDFPSSSFLLSMLICPLFALSLSSHLPFFFHFFPARPPFAVFSLSLSYPVALIHSLRFPSFLRSSSPFLFACLIPVLLRLIHSFLLPFCFFPPVAFSVFPFHPPLLPLPFPVFSLSVIFYSNLGPDSITIATYFPAVFYHCVSQ